MVRKIPFFLYLLSLLLSGSLAAQTQQPSYPFSRDFKPGLIFLNDGTQMSGLIKWFAAQEEKLIFRENEKAPKQKFPPEELAGFQVDSFRFRSISGFEVYGNDFALLGKMSAIKHTFGHLLDSGKVNTYLVYYSGYNALGGAIQSYPNIVFERKTDSGNIYAAYPVEIRMRDKKFEKVKENLLSFFRDYPEIVEKIKTIQQQDNITEIVNMFKRLE
jgi:hypothetical protein